MITPQEPTLKLQFQDEVNTPNPFQANLSVKDEISKTFANENKTIAAQMQLFNCNIKLK